MKCFSTQRVVYPLPIKIIFTTFLVSQNEGPQWIDALVSCFSVMNGGSQNDGNTRVTTEEKWGEEEVALENN